MTGQYVVFLNGRESPQTEINAQVGKTMLIFRPALKNECRLEENYSWSAKPAITNNGEH
jgi:hypothetical protein